MGSQPQRGDRTRSSRNLSPLRGWFLLTLQPTTHAVGYNLPVLRTSCPTVPSPPTRPCPSARDPSHTTPQRMDPVQVPPPENLSLRPLETGHPHGGTATTTQCVLLRGVLPASLPWESRTTPWLRPPRSPSTTVSSRSRKASRSNAPPAPTSPRAPSAPASMTRAASSSPIPPGPTCPRRTAQEPHAPHPAPRRHQQRRHLRQVRGLRRAGHVPPRLPLA